MRQPHVYGHPPRPAAVAERRGAQVLQHSQHRQQHQQCALLCCGEGSLLCATEWLQQPHSHRRAHTPEQVEGPATFCSS